MNEDINKAKQLLLKQLLLKQLTPKELIEELFRKQTFQEMIEENPPNRIFINDFVFICNYCSVPVIGIIDSEDSIGANLVMCRECNRKYKLVALVLEVKSEKELVISENL